MIEWIAFIISITGAFFFITGKSKHVPYALLFAVIGSCLWLLYGINNNIISIALTNLVFIIVEGIALYKWSTKNKS